MAAPDPNAPIHTAFFYGTLMAPSVLRRVVSAAGQPSPIYRKPPMVFRAALLPGHKRHRVLNADYPAVVPSSSSPASPDDENTVRGTYVTGLTPNDIARLDVFEGDEYDRVTVRVRLLPEKSSEGGGVPEPLVYGGIIQGFNPDGTGGENPKYPTRTKSQLRDEPPEWKETQTYIWTAGDERLEDGEWDFDHFRREKLHLWAGQHVQDEGMMDVDKQFGEPFDGPANAHDGIVDGTGGRGVRTGEFESAMQERQKAAGEVVRNAV